MVKGISILIIGFVVGVGSTWFWFHLSGSSYTLSAENLRRVLNYTNVEILKENFQCEGAGETVGDVISDIISCGASRLVNPINSSCNEGKCAYVVSNCYPWQSDSCGLIMLSFVLENNKEIDPHSFKCLEVP